MMNAVTVKTLDHELQHVIKVSHDVRGEILSSKPHAEYEDPNLVDNSPLVPDEIPLQTESKLVKKIKKPIVNALKLLIQKENEPSDNKIAYLKTMNKIESIVHKSRKKGLTAA